MIVFLLVFGLVGVVRCLMASLLLMPPDVSPFCGIEGVKIRIRMMMIEQDGFAGFATCDGPAHYFSYNIVVPSTLQVFYVFSYS